MTSDGTSPSTTAWSCAAWPGENRSCRQARHDHPRRRRRDRRSLMIVHSEFRDLETPTGTMRTHVYAPEAPGRRFPGLILYPEIFQQTGPIVRLSMQFAAQGYVVMAPEIYHEHEPPGTVLAYDDV